MPPRKKIDKPYNSGTMSVSAFWGMIRSCLRQKSRWWKPIADAKVKARRSCKNCGRQKWEYQCNKCKEWWPDKEIQVDHIIEAGELKSGKDLEKFVERLFCEVDGLQVLCTTCHNEKTQEYRNSKKKDK
jgi:5-methylcytosine-specific restriction endonuclease McrA